MLSLIPHLSNKTGDYFMKKVLVVSYIALMNTTPNGRTMRSLLQSVGKENLSNLYVLGKADEDACSSAYKISNRDVLKSIFTFKECGKEDVLSKNDNLGGFSEEEIQKKPKKALKYLMREIAWGLGHWHGKKLKSWLKQQSLDCVVYMYGDSPSLQKVSLFISKYLNIPLIVYSCEDYCFKKYNYIDRKEHSLPFKLYFHHSKKSTKALFKRADALICNSDELGELYCAHYPIKSVSTVTMASDWDTISSPGVKPIEDTKIIYMGAIGKYRTNALVTIADTLQEIDPKLHLDVYGRVSDPEILEEFNSCEGLNFHGFVTYEEVERITREASLNLEVINLDPIVERGKKFGLSTKFADALRCGTPFLVYAPEKMVETIIAKKHNCAFVVSNNAQLKSTLYTALFDRDAREKQLLYAQKTTSLLFDKQRNIDTVEKVLSSVIEKNGQ